MWPHDLICPSVLIIIDRKGNFILVTFFREKVYIFVVELSINNIVKEVMTDACTSIQTYMRLNLFNLAELLCHTNHVYIRKHKHNMRDISALVFSSKTLK